MYVIIHCDDNNVHDINDNNRHNMNYFRNMNMNLQLRFLNYTKIRRDLRSRILPLFKNTFLTEIYKGQKKFPKKKFL